MKNIISNLALQDQLGMELNIRNQPVEAPLNIEEEEALSLCDFPRNSVESDDETQTSRSQDQHKPSSPSLDFFEFFNGTKETCMSHAEDIIFCGKLVPLKLIQNPTDQQILTSVSQDDDDTKSISLSLRCCKSSPRTNTSRSDSTNTTSKTMMGSSRSLDSEKPHRNSSLGKKSNVSMNNKSRSNINNKPSWNFIMFGGLLKASSRRIDIQDMKNRQSRRRLSTFLPEMVDGDGKIPATSSRSFWGHDLLKVLSCKGHSTVGFKEPSIVRRRSNFAV